MRSTIQEIDVTTTPDDIGKLGNPAVESEDLLPGLSTVWAEQLQDPNTAAAIASLLHADVKDLRRIDPPISMRQDGSGLAGSDIVLMVATWVATDVVLKALADLGKDAVKDAIREVWVRYLKPALERRQERPGALGEDEDLGG